MGHHAFFCVAREREDPGQVLYDVELAIPVSSGHRKKRVFPSGKERVDVWWCT